MFASVVIDVLTSHLKDTYTYRVPSVLEKFVGIGSRVLVDFGAQRRLGYIIELSDESSYDGKTNDIVEVLDYTNELTPEQIELAKRISKETKCPLIKALDAVFPPFLKTKYREFITLKMKII